MAYQKRKTVAKAAAPAVFIIGLANLLQYVSGALGNEVEAEASYNIVTSLYAGGVALLNWLKNRKR